jgi:hypothetical protein
MRASTEFGLLLCGIGLLGLILLAGVIIALSGVLGAFG